MIVHLYAQCWNDAWMLPFFFRHYDGLVDRYFMYDDGSRDETLSLLESHPKVERRRFVRHVAASFVLSEQSFSDQCWKLSKGLADWVIVTDIDEHLCHSGERAYLSSCKAAGVTAIPALGFQMISDREPMSGQSLARDYRMGTAWEPMMKLSVFNPDAISEINFDPGRHRANPTGQVRFPDADELLLLHYKYMGFERTHRRHQQLRQGLGSVDVEKGWGHKYSWSEEQLREDWMARSRGATDITSFGRAASDYPIQPWWRRDR